MTMSQSAARIWKMVMIQSGLRVTPSWAARARPSSIWKPGGSPALLAKGSELGWAHRPSVPNARIVSSDRAARSWPPSKRAASVASGRSAFMPCLATDGSGLRRSSLIGLQLADVLDDRVHLRGVEDFAEGRHRARLADHDAFADEVVAALRVHELRPLAGRPAAIGMAPAAGRREELVDVDRFLVRRRLVRCGAGLLRCRGQGGAEGDSDRADPRQSQNRHVSSHQFRISLR